MKLYVCLISQSIIGSELKYTCLSISGKTNELQRHEAEPIIQDTRSDKLCLFCSFIGFFPILFFTCNANLYLSLVFKSCEQSFMCFWYSLFETFSFSF